MSFLKNLVKGIGKGAKAVANTVGKVAEVAGAVVSVVPGVGPIAGGALSTVGGLITKVTESKAGQAVATVANAVSPTSQVPPASSDTATFSTQTLQDAGLYSADGQIINLPGLTITAEKSAAPASDSVPEEQTDNLKWYLLAGFGVLGLIYLLVNRK